MELLLNIIKLMRPHQWVKNLFCFLPLFFDRKVLDTEYLIPAIFAFLAYCFAASGIYCFNDIYDVEADRKHPKKCNRPIAKGIISVPTAYSIMIILWFFAILISWLAPYSIENGRIYVLSIICLYIIINIAYCIYLKRKPIVDVFTIAVGFVLRVLIGGLATGIWISHWIVLMTFLLALFLAFAKRRDDVIIYENSGIKARKNVDRYNTSFMNQAIGIVASITMVCYIMYTVSPEVIDRFGNPYIYLTSIFVLAGIIRYLQKTLVDEKSGSPTKVLLKDRFIQAVIVGWILSFAILLYL